MTKETVTIEVPVEMLQLFSDIGKLVSEYMATTSNASITNRVISKNTSILTNNSISNVQRDEIPTLDDVKAYISEKNYTIDPIRFYEYYNKRDWRDNGGYTISNWRLKVDSWVNNTISDRPNKSVSTTTRNKISVADTKGLLDKI